MMQDAFFKRGNQANYIVKQLKPGIVNCNHYDSAIEGSYTIIYLKSIT